MSKGKASPERKPKSMKTIKRKGQPLCSGYQKAKQLTMKEKKKYINMAKIEASRKADRCHKESGSKIGGLMIKNKIVISIEKKARFMALSAMSRESQFLR